MTDINLSPGIPETVLPPEDPELVTKLAVAEANKEPRSAVALIVSNNPLFLDGWRALGDLGRDSIERYAAYRVGYHRGLDALRKAGWRGSGYVRHSHVSNRGFLGCLTGLRECAQQIGELEEVDRCDLFLAQLDPDM